MPGIITSRSSRSEVLEAVKQNGRALNLASTALKDDREIVLEAVNQDGYALNWASAALKDDREIVLEAVKHNGRALARASAALKDDREIVLVAIKQNWFALYLASAVLKDDREIVLEAVKQNGQALGYASAVLQNGGLREYLNHLKSNVFSVPKQTFIATILFGAKAAPSISGSARDSRSRLCDNSKCVLSLLRPSVRVPGSMSLSLIHISEPTRP